MTGWQTWLMSHLTKKHLSPKILLSSAAFLACGLLIGWWFGTWSTCGTACSFDVALFDALGTWVGGVALALGAFIFTISQANAAKRRDQEEALSTAIACALRAEPSFSTNKITKVVFKFNNKTTTNIHDVSAHMEGGPSLHSDRQVKPGRAWGFVTSPTRLAITDTANSEDEAKQIINQLVLPKVVFAFSVNGHRFVRKDREVYLFDDAPKWRSASDSCKLL